MNKPGDLFNAQAKIKVIGVGGAGCNAVNRMVSEGVDSVEFVVMNTDAQVLAPSKADIKIRLGENATRGLGAGGDPQTGEAAAKESERSISEVLDGSDMVFITAGMGGGTGTGAAPIVAELAKRQDILTVAVVSKPFGFEGPKRRKVAEEGALRLAEQVDTLIVVPNDRLLDVVDKKASVSEAFQLADDVLRQGVQGISDIITKPGLINLDFADVRSVMKNAGVATMGLGRARGEGRAKNAAQLAANSPLLETGLQGAKKLLVNITTGSDFNLGEAYEVMEYLQQFVDPEEAEIFMGHVLDDAMGDEVLVTVLAAGMHQIVRRQPDRMVFPEVEAPVRQAVVAQTAPSNAATSYQPITAQPMVQAPEIENTKPISLEEIDLDIPSFLRRQKLGN